jgi:hypothetical protein
MTSSGRRSDGFVASFPLGENQIGAPYASAGRTTAVYTRRAFWNVAPQVDAAILVIALVCRSSLLWTFHTWEPHFNLESISTPSTRTCGAGKTVVPSSVMVATRLNFLACLVRCISSYLDGEKANPCLLAQPIHRSYTRASAKQLSSIDLPQARMLMSSTNPKLLDRSPMPL